jgi:hypothetical protein
MQVYTLRLPPWATVPCYLLDDVDVVLARGDDGVRGDYNAAVLLKRMQRHSISRWHPDPINALREAEKRDAASGLARRLEAEVGVDHCCTAAGGRRNGHEASHPVDWPLIGLRAMWLLRQDRLAIKPNFRPMPTFIAISGRVDVVGEEETSRANGNRLTSSASASVKSHVKILESPKR